MNERMKTKKKKKRRAKVLYNRDTKKNSAFKKENCAFPKFVLAQKTFPNSTSSFCLNFSSYILQYLHSRNPSLDFSGATRKHRPRFRISPE